LARPLVGGASGPLAGPLDVVQKVLVHKKVERLRRHGPPDDSRGRSGLKLSRRLHVAQKLSRHRRPVPAPRRSRCFRRDGGFLGRHSSAAPPDRKHRLDRADHFRDTLVGRLQLNYESGHMHLLFDLVPPSRTTHVQLRRRAGDRWIIRPSRLSIPTRAAVQGHQGQPHAGRAHLPGAVRARVDAGSVPARLPSRGRRAPSLNPARVTSSDLAVARAAFRRH